MCGSPHRKCRTCMLRIVCLCVMFLLCLRLFFFCTHAFFSAVAIIFSSRAFSYLCSMLLHFGRFDASPFLECVLISRFFMSLLQTSLNLSWGRPVCLFPASSSPQRMSLGMRPSSIRCTRPNQCSLCYRRRVHMLGEPSRERTSAFVTFPCR